MSHNWVPNFTHTLHFIIFAIYFHLFIRFSWVFFLHQIHFNGTISRFVYNFESQNFKLIVHCSRPLKVRLVTSQSNLNRRQFNSCIIKLVSTKKSSNWIIVCVQSSCACSAKRSKKKKRKIYTMSITFYSDYFEMIHKLMMMLKRTIYHSYLAWNDRSGNNIRHH